MQRAAGSTPQVLFVCTGLGARAVMAQLLAESLAEGRIEVHSASFDTGTIGRFPRKLMAEIGLDWPAEPPPTVFDRFKAKQRFDCVITLCHAATTELCPIFQSNVDCLYGRESVRLSWQIPDLRSLEGPSEQRLEGGRAIRAALRQQVEGLLKTLVAEAGLEELASR